MEKHVLANYFETGVKPSNPAVLRQVATYAIERCEELTASLISILGMLKIIRTENDYWHLKPQIEEVNKEVMNTLNGFYYFDYFTELGYNNSSVCQLGFHIQQLNKELVMTLDRIRPTVH